MSTGEIRKCVEKRKDSGRCGENAFYDDLFSYECVDDDDGVNVPGGGLGIPPNNHCYSKTGLKDWLSTNPTRQDPYNGGHFSEADHVKILEHIGEIEALTPEPSLDSLEQLDYELEELEQITIRGEQIITEMRNNFPEDMLEELDYYLSSPREGNHD